MSLKEERCLQEINAGNGEIALLSDILSFPARPKQAKRFYAHKRTHAWCARKLGSGRKKSAFVVKSRLDGIRRMTPLSNFELPDYQQVALRLILLITTMGFQVQRLLADLIQHRLFDDDREREEVQSEIAFIESEFDAAMKELGYEKVA